MALAALDAHVAYFRWFTEQGSGRVIDDGGVVSWHSRHPMGALINAAIRTDETVPATDVLDEAARRFTTGYEVLTLQGRDDDVFDAAGARGAELGAPEPVQIHEQPGALHPVDESGIELRGVTDRAGVADVAHVNQAATATYGFPSDLFSTLMANPSTVLSEDLEAVVAYVQDRPVATAQVFLHGRTGYVGWVATTSAEMRRGLGTLVTCAAAERASLRGASTLSLMASPMGAPLYRRLGFTDVAWLRGAQFPHS